MGQVSDLAKKLKIKASDTEVTEVGGQAQLALHIQRYCQELKLWPSNHARCRKNYYGKLQRVGITFAQVIGVLQAIQHEWLRWY